MFVTKVSSKSVYPVTLLLSLIISVWVIYHNDVINSDGVCYLAAAENYLSSESLANLMHTCGQAQWPFYSLLVAQVTKLLHLSPFNSANIINVIFDLISVSSFLLIAEALGGKRILWLAAITILCAHDFNSLRNYIIRDHGYWAFYITSIYLFIRFLKQPSLLRALLWSFCVVLAFMFRLEAIAFLILCPFSVFLIKHYSSREKIKSFFALNSLMLIFILGLGCYSVLNTNASTLHFGRLNEIANASLYTVQNLVNNFNATKLQLSQHILSIYARSDAGLILFLVFIIWYVIAVIKSLGLGYSLFAIFSTKFHDDMSPVAKFTLSNYIMVNIAVTLIFLFEAHFISKRYLLGLSFTLMFFVPLGMLALYHLRRDNRHRLLLGVGLLLIVTGAVGGIYSFGYSKNYIRAAGEWVKSSAQQRIFSNDLVLLYYAKPNDKNIFTDYNGMLNQISTRQRINWHDYDFIMLHIDRHADANTRYLLNSIPYASIKVFKNRRLDKVVIFQVMQEKKH